MTIVRIGNNIHVLWKIYNNTGSKYSLSGKVRKLWLSSAALEKEIDTYQIQYRNELVFTIDAGDLTRYGTYKLVLQLSESDSQTEDATYDLTQVFQVVSSSYPDAMNAIDGEVEVEFTSILNNVVVERIEGLSAYEIAVNNGFEGTEEEWIESLKGEGITELPKNIAYFGDDGEEAIVPDFDPFVDTVWNKVQTLSAEQKAQVLRNLGLDSLIADGDSTAYTANVGTITGITMNGSSKGTSGVVDLGTVITDVSGKQDVISDLATIRSGASAGATAYQKPSGGIPSTDMTSAVQTSLGKADSALQSHQDISGKEDKANKVTSLSSSSTDTQYPSAKCVYDLIGDIESVLDAIINGTNNS